MVLMGDYFSSLKAVHVSWGVIVYKSQLGSAAPSHNPLNSLHSPGFCPSLLPNMNSTQVLDAWVAQRNLQDSAVCETASSINKAALLAPQVFLATL